MRKLQIGVMGSAADLKYDKKTQLIAERVGELLAEKQCILFFGAEKDFDSLSTAACRGARKKSGLTVGVTYGKGKNIYQKDVSVVICSGLVRGGGRELVLTLSCDAVIAINGGSGTLTELAIAYQADIPMIVVSNTGGWSDAMANKYFDGRLRRKVLAAKTPEEAVALAIKEATKYLKRQRNR